MDTKIIEIATERTMEDTLKAVGTEYWYSTDQSLAIYGAIAESQILTLVVRPEVQQSILNFVNKLNNEWHKAQAQKGVLK